MSSTLRAAAVASSAALLLGGGAIATAGAAGAAPKTAAAVSVSPTFAQVASTLTLHGSGFATGETVTIGASAKQAATYVSPSKMTVVVPSDATSGRITIYDALNHASAGPSFVLQQTTIGRTTLSSSQLVYHSKITVTGTLLTEFAHAPVRGQLAALQHKSGGGGWYRAGGTSLKKTGQRGLVRWHLRAGTTGKYRVHFRGTHAYTSVTSGAQALKVFPRLTLDQVRTVPARTDSDITGTIAPKVTGEVILQKWVNGVWKHAATAAVENGHFSFTVSPSSLGSVRYRVLRRYDGALATTFSHPLTVHVVNRELSIGDIGPDVLALQKRLRALHYDLGPVSDSYEYDALHAVTAFEKVQGLPANGEVTTAVWKALNHPKVPHLKHADPSLTYSVEVNLKKQILLIARNGKVWRILDTSTAGGYLYTNSSGATERAVTPTGHFSIQYKITGWHVSSLGELYYPSYFTNTGYAIHGEGNGNDGSEVPPYANSHGCVRITNDAVLRYYYHVFTVGTQVWVY